MRLWAIIMKELRAVREDPSFHLAALVSPLLFLLAFSLMLSSGIVLPLATYPDAGESAFLQGVADYRAPDGTPYLSLSPAAADVPRSDAENDLLVVVQEPQLENGVLSGELIHYVNDVNENMTKNYRNRVDGAVRQTIDALRADGGVTVREHTRYAEDIPWDTGFGVSVLVFSLMLSGLLFGMLAMTSEWSDRTTTLLRLAPASPRLLICGKLLAGLLCACLLLAAGCGAGGGRESATAKSAAAESATAESATAESAEEEEALTIYFFHDTACGSCDGTEEFRAIISEQIYPYSEARPYRLNVKNVFKSEERDRAEELLMEEAGLTIKEVSFPLMMINGKVYEGLPEIGDNIQKEYFAGMVSEAVYFYREDCPECIDLAPFMDSLPETVEVGGVSLPLAQERLNSREGDNGDKIRELFEAYQVPEEDQMVPIVFVGSHYLAGAEEIEENLIPYLEAGYGLRPEEKGET